MLRAVTKTSDSRLRSNVERLVVWKSGTVLYLKNAVFWDVAPCSSCVIRRFGGTYCLHIQGRKISHTGSGLRLVRRFPSPLTIDFPCVPFSLPSWSYIAGCFRLALSLQPPAHARSSLADFSTLKAEVIRSSETSVHKRTTRRHMPKTAFFIVAAGKISNLT
jgi:hypothetical protein